MSSRRELGINRSVPRRTHRCGGLARAERPHGRRPHHPSGPRSTDQPVVDRGSRIGNSQGVE